MSTSLLNCVRFSAKRFNSTSALNAPVLEALPHRTLIRVAGSEVSPFLQGLVTNDIEHLHSGHPSIFTMFLNSAGRILYDALIYRTSEKNTLLIECDKEASPVLQKHLKLYRVRRKIDIVDVGDELQVYVAFNPDSSSDLHLSESLKEANVEAYRDPRIADLGVRILAKTGEKIVENKGKGYKWLRYSLGVGEGIHDHPPGDSFPLECNADYLHGVSFQKGCYIGQELTARVHHTGIVRKRLMPLTFTKVPKNIPDKKIAQDGVNLGKLRGIEGDLGLASLRFEKALSFKEVKVGDGVAIISKPKWWPCEAQDKINLK